MSAPKSGGAEMADLEALLDDYEGQRGPKKTPESGQRPTVESLLGELDTAVVENGGEKGSASAASKDLDNLMSSLSDFKMQQQVETPYAQPRKSKQATPPSEGNQLDSMLGSLQSDMTKHGISTIPKGDCAACQKTIVGQVVIALGKMWHPEHFICANCGEELGHRNFFERSGKAYCENDYHNLFSPRCAYCNGAIKDKCVTALEKTWHPEHFFCAQCGRDFGDEGFHEKEGKAFCRQDYFGMFAPRCRGCQRAITNNYITALNTQWHPECFVCQDCKQPFH
jgi:paxillin